MGQVVRNNQQFETHIQADHRGQLVKQGPDSGAVDAFGRARVSEPFTMFDNISRYNKGLDQWNEIIAGSGTSTHLPNESSVALAVMASGDSVLRRTRRRFPYQAGKSLAIMQSFVGAPLASGLIQEIGYFDDNNGIMVRASGTTVQFVIRSSTTGSAVENVIDQDEWNIDTLPSLDFSKANIFTADMEWLGVGRVRCGFVIDGEYYYCHEFNHANNIESVYMSSPVLPLSYRIEAAGEASGTMKEVCAAVASEAGYEPEGPIYTAGRGVGTFTAISAETMVAAIRMVSGRTDNVILPSQVDVTIGGDPGANVAAQWRLRLNPTISGTWTEANNGRGSVETMASGTFSGGTVIDAGLVGARTSIEFNPSSALALSLGANASGESDTLALTIECSSSVNATGLLGWREVL
jgi:hypothetical protein